MSLSLATRGASSAELKTSLSAGSSSGAYSDAFGNNELREGREVVAVKSDQLAPSGSCLCGCGQKTKRGRFFYPSHDSKAVWAVMKDLYGDREPWAAFVYEHGYGPGGPNAPRLRQLLG